MIVDRHASSRTSRATRSSGRSGRSSTSRSRTTCSSRHPAKRTVQVHPLLVLVAVLFGATLLGVLGALVAIPVAALDPDRDQGLAGSSRRAPRRPVLDRRQRPPAPSRRARQPARPRARADRAGTPPTPEQAGPDVRADHRADLGHEQRGLAHDLARPASTSCRRLVGGLDVLHDPGVGAVGRALLGVVEPAAANARALVRTRSIGVISLSSVRIGLILSAVPSQADAAPIRPPRRRYSSVSTANHILHVVARSPARARPPRRRRRRAAPARRGERDQARGRRRRSPSR